MTLTQEISSTIETTLQTLNLPTASIHVEPTADAKFGDCTSTIAMQLFQSVDHGQWNSPRALAEAIAAELRKADASKSLFSEISIAGPGFINFTVDNSYFTGVLNRFHTNSFEFHDGKDRKHAIVEYSSPNIAKPFTVGHLRSTIIGDAIASLLAVTGYEVKRDNHLGDWGTQFGKLIVAITTLGAGDEAKNIEIITNAAEPVKELVRLYVEFHDRAESDPALEDAARAWFTKLEQHDPQATKLWKLCIDWSWVEFSRIYAELGVEFTENNGRGFGESFFEDKMTDVVKTLEESGYLKTGDEGAKLFFFPNEELPPLMVLKKDGSTLYATRDLATDAYRYKTHGNDILIINEVGAEQELYFRQIYRIEELLGWSHPGSRVHVKHGLYRFQDGKMSTRKGNTIWLNDVITEAKKRALELSKDKNEAVAKDVAIAALKWNDLKRSSHLDITFDWDEILSMSGNSGPYVQYTAVRARSVIKKATSSLLTAATEGYQFSPRERLLVRQFLYFEDTVKRAAATYSPQLLATYLYALATEYNSFYTTEKILGAGDQEQMRLLLCQVTQSVLTTGLKILGVNVPEKM